MNDEDETRVMAVPASLLEEARGPRTLFDSPGAQTPCVGVPSVGETHFGQTQLVAQPSVVVRADVTETSPAVPRGEGERKSAGRFGLPASLAPHVRPLALCLGVLLGIGAAFGTGVLSPKRKSAAVLRAAQTSVEVSVVTSGGKPLLDVPIRMGKQIVMTDEGGQAVFSGVQVRERLRVQGACPSGYSGEVLDRELSEQVARASATWAVRLICVPDFVQVALRVLVEGCGEMHVAVDGVESGTTESGVLEVSRKITRERVVEVSVSPTEGKCEGDSSQEVLLSPDAPQAAVSFEGAPPRSKKWRPPRKESAPSRPYRL